VLCSNAFAAGIDTLPAYIPLKHRAVLNSWLVSHPESRLAIDADCNCAEGLEQLKGGEGGPWQPKPNFHPFYVAGDFNSDGKEDFAVVLLKGAQRYAVVFNGGSGQPVYFESIGNTTALFFGPPRAKPYRLVLGSFMSEGRTLEPVGHGYVLK
jgi:hypothetical protein